MADSRAALERLSFALVYQVTFISPVLLEQLLGRIETTLKTVRTVAPDVASALEKTLLKCIEMETGDRKLFLVEYWLERKQS